jgi:small subunit ribosomal protein S1
MKALQPEPVKEEEPAKSAASPSGSAQFRERYAQAPAAARPKKAIKKNRKRDENGEITFTLDEPASTEVEPTAMEIALREAMEKAKSRKQEDKNRKSKNVSSEQDDILSRTLESKPRS